MWWVTNKSISLTFHVCTFSFNANAALSPTTKFVRNCGFVHWRINYLEKLAILTKSSSASSWQRQIRYACHHGPSHVILLNLLQKIPQPFLQQLTLRRYFLQFLWIFSFWSGRTSLISIQTCLMNRKFLTAVMNGKFRWNRILKAFWVSK